MPNDLDYVAQVRLRDAQKLFSGEFAGQVYRRPRPIAEILARRRTLRAEESMQAA